MQAQPEVRAADDARVIFGLEPARAQLDAPRRQAGEAPLELGAPRAVAGDEDHQISGNRRPLPPLPSRECDPRAAARLR